MKKTVDDFLKAGPCPAYNREKIWELVGDDGVTPEELVKLHIPIRDALWGLIFVWMEPTQCLDFAKACHDTAQAKAATFPEAKMARKAAYNAEKALIVARNSIPAKDDRPDRKAAWKAAEAVLDTAWLYWDAAFTQDLLETALFIIGEEGEEI